MNQGALHAGQRADFPRFVRVPAVSAVAAGEAFACIISAMTSRQKAMLAGMFLSKFDKEGLRRLGFKTLREACNVIGAALGVHFRSVRNYRDEFDPVLSATRKGWENRPMRPDRKAMLEQYSELKLPEFADLLKRVVYRNPEIDAILEAAETRQGEDSSFARRLITGQAAEEYFRKNYRKVPEFSGLRLQDTTGFGCGFDFRLSAENISYGVEVKGIKESSGSVVLTEKEHRVADIMRGDFFLFVVKNLAETPAHETHRDPLHGRLRFQRVERAVTQVNWAATIG